MTQSVLNKISKTIRNCINVTALTSCVLTNYNLSLPPTHTKAQPCTSPPQDLTVEMEGGKGQEGQNIIELFALFRVRITA